MKPTRLRLATCGACGRRWTTEAPAAKPEECDDCAGYSPRVAEGFEEGRFSPPTSGFDRPKPWSPRGDEGGGLA